MSRTELDGRTLAASLRRMAGDGSMEWCHEPMQTSVLLDVADMLDESAPRLPHFWTHDGTLHVEAPKLPEGIAVTLPDERDREVRTARVWRYVPVRTANRVVASNADTDHATGHCECGACGGAIDFWDKWCRHCGARMEGE